MVKGKAMNQPRDLFPRCLLVFPFLLAFSGCANFWEDVTSKDFKVKSLFVSDNPLVVLEKSTDGNKRAKALRALHEPARRTGHSPQEQDTFVKILTTTATSDRLPLCRLAAIKSLADYKDPRAVEAMKKVYLDAKPFTPDINSTINQQALIALGKSNNPSARELLVLVARQPPKTADSAFVERQQAMDERMTAVRALARFNHYEVAQTLVSILKTEKDVGLRDCAHQSLVAVTGKKLPADAKEWETMLNNAAGRGDALAGDSGKKWSLVAWWNK